MRVYLFGVVFLFSCFSYVLYIIVNEVKWEYGSEVEEVLCCNFYLDDCLWFIGIED